MLVAGISLPGHTQSLYKKAHEPESFGKVTEASGAEDAGDQLDVVRLDANTFAVTYLRDYHPRVRVVSVSSDGDDLTLLGGLTDESKISLGIRAAYCGPGRIVTANRVVGGVELAVWDLSGSTPVILDKHIHDWSTVTDWDLTWIRDENNGAVSYFALTVTGVHPSYSQFGTEMSLYRVYSSGFIAKLDTKGNENSVHVATTRLDDNSVVLARLASNHQVLLTRYTIANDYTWVYGGSTAISGFYSNGIDVTALNNTKFVLSSIDDAGISQILCAIDPSTGNITTPAASLESGNFTDVASCSTGSYSFAIGGVRDGKLSVQDWDIDASNQPIIQGDVLDITAKQTKIAYLNTGFANQRIVTVHVGEYTRFGKHLDNILHVTVWDIILPISPGKTTKVAEVVEPGERIGNFSCYPNPCSAGTQFSFTLAQDADVTLKLYNQLGAEVDVIYNGHMNAGEQTIQWDASKLPAGLYWYSLDSDTERKTGKLVIE